MKDDFGKAFNFGTVIFRFRTFKTTCFIKSPKAK